ncbi:MAG: polysaccharide biosynthesis tyrosine autokinase [Reichenbachiella sp.]
MNPRNLHILKEQASKSEIDDKDPFDNIDFEKLKQVFISSIIWVALILVLSNTLAFLYIRYTKPVFSSESILKLDIKSEAGLLGISNPMDQDIKGISGEIEILKSRLFANKVVDAIGLNVSYFHPGRSHLYDERYGNSPFKVEFKTLNPIILDRPFDLQIIDDTHYILSYEINGVMEQSNHEFGELVINDFVELKITPTNYFAGQKYLVDFYFILNSKAALTRYFEQNLKVEPLNFNANTIKISLSDYNKYKAQNLLKAVDTIYLAYTKHAKNLAVEQKIKFLTDQMEKTSKELEAFEDYFEDFTIQNRTTNLSNDLNNTIILLNQLDSQSFNIRNHISAIDLAINQLNNDIPISALKLPKEPLALIKEYNELKEERELKLANYNEKTQVIQLIDHKIELTKNSASERLAAYKESLLEAQNSVARKKNLLENEFVKLPSMGTSYNKNRRLYSLQENFYFSLIQTKIQLEIARAGTVTNFVVLSQPTLPNEPIKPQKLLVLGGGFIIGLVISFLFIALRYLLDDKISSIKELERLMFAPLLGMVPKYRAEKLPVTRLVVTTNPKSAISESLRSIRTNMEFLASGDNNKVLSITSTVSGEGKTFIAVNLAAIFAFSNKKVVVVDLDMRKPKVHLAFSDEKSEKGTSTILIGKNTIDECLNDTEVEGLYYIGAGTVPPNPSELIRHENFDKFIEDLKSKFDIVLLDTPPVGLVTDGILVMKKSDLPMYVVRSDYSRKSYLKSVHRLISNQRFEHLSVIFNSVGNQGDYGYGYGDGGGYYQEDDLPTSSKLKKFFSRRD